MAGQVTRGDARPAPGGWRMPGAGGREACPAGLLPNIQRIDHRWPDVRPGAGSRPFAPAAPAGRPAPVPRRQVLPAPAALGAGTECLENAARRDARPPALMRRREQGAGHAVGAYPGAQALRQTKPYAPFPDHTVAVVAGLSPLQRGAGRGWRAGAREIIGGGLQGRRNPRSRRRYCNEQGGDPYHQLSGHDWLGWRRTC